MSAKRQRLLIDGEEFDFERIRFPIQLTGVEPLQRAENDLSVHSQNALNEQRLLQHNFLHTNKQRVVRAEAKRSQMT